MAESFEKEIFLSIIINNYNYGQFVSEAIESALAIVEDDCEIIVVDDGSKDESLAIISEYEGLHLVAKENGGQASALNAGFAAARGRYVHFLDSDDLLVPDALNVIRRTMPGKHMVHFASTVLDQQLGVVSYYNSARAKPKSDLWSQYFGKGSAWLYPMSCNVFSRELLSQVMPLPEASWRVCADQVLLAIGSAYADYFGSKETINNYRLHGENLYFSDNLSLLEGHIYEDRYHFKNSTHFRNFFVAGCDALMRVENVSACAAVLGNWIAYGENIRDYGMLTETHRSDIEAALEKLFSSQSLSYWQNATGALRGDNIQPQHLEAFHNKPGHALILSESVDTPTPQLPFNEWLDFEDLEGHLEGGFIVWHEDSERQTYSLSQACKFSAQMNALSGFIRATFEIVAESLGGDLRLVNHDGRVAEVVTYDDGVLIADIPCDWVDEGCLAFHFVFERMQIPQTAVFSSYDLSMTGAYLLRARFAAPAASHFYKPMPLEKCAKPGEFLSLLRHLKTDRAAILSDSGSVRLSRKLTSFSMSLPFCQDGQEWLEFELANTTDHPMAISVTTEFAGDRKQLGISEIVRIPAQETIQVPVAIGFQMFSDSPPEVTFACLAEPEGGSDILIRTMRLFIAPIDTLFMIGANAMRFHYGSIASAAVGPKWEPYAEGILPSPHDKRRNADAEINVVLQEPIPAEVALTFKRTVEGSDRNLQDRTPAAIGISVNGEVWERELSADGACIVPTGGQKRLTISGWWSEDPRKPLTLSRIETDSGQFPSLTEQNPQSP